MADRREIEAMEIYAWVGWDEYGSGRLGLKQGVVPAGTIPMVAIDREKLERFWSQAEIQAQRYGRRIFLVRLKVVEIVRETESGGIG